MVSWPYELSHGNKMLIGRVCPSLVSIEIVTYHTRETRGWSKLKPGNVKEVRITNQLIKDAISITHLGLKGQKNLHLASYADSWNHSTRNIFELLHMGSYVTQGAELMRDTIENKEYQGYIGLNQPFDQTPGVVVWLCL
ncbi:hypothetical protein F4818DRAFT_446454 [Hypoxylon cercidicola]|nr:hypothetical protein F4818DRAFT_446454 [Hypoxylon cercidicola]